MPKIGSIAIYKDRRHIWVACPICGHERWVKLRHPKPYSLHCGKCRSWKGGKSTNKQGYVLVRLLPNDFFYSMVDCHGYVREHRLVMAKSLGRSLQKWEVVHHKNGVKNDNRLENLELAGNLGEHSANHSRGYKDGYQKGLYDSHEARIKRLEARITILEAENILLQTTERVL